MSNSILLKKRAKKYSNKYYRNPLPKRPGARWPWAYFFFLITIYVLAPGHSAIWEKNVNFILLIVRKIKIIP